MFSNLFSRSISLATVTPSLVTVGEPKDFSMTTLRPLGPRVTATASESTRTPRRIASRAPWWKKISLAAICCKPPENQRFWIRPGLALPGCERQTKGPPAIVNAIVRCPGLQSPVEALFARARWGGTLPSRADPLWSGGRGHGARHPLAGRPRGAGQGARGGGGGLGPRPRLPGRALSRGAPHLGLHPSLRGQRHPAAAHRAPEPARCGERLATERGRVLQADCVLPPRRGGERLRELQLLLRQGARDS